MPGTDPVPVVVHSADPITHAGVVELVRAIPGARLVDEPGPGVVRLVAVGDADEGVFAALDRSGDGTVSVVLAVGRVRAALRVAAARRGVAVVGATGSGFDELARELAMVLARGAVPRPVDRGPLTPRQVDVLRLLADGLGTAEIAERLRYSERTVKNVVYDLTTRLGVRNRTHAVALAIREGLI